MSFLKPDPPEPQPLPDAPSEGDYEVERKRMEELRKMRLSRGRQSTILTGGLLGQAPTQRKTLLGA